MTRTLCQRILATLLALEQGYAAAVPSPSTLLPMPSGPHGVSLSSMQLTDHSREDPFPSHNKPRKLMISAFYPSVDILHCQSIIQPYMPPITTTFEEQAYSENYYLPNQTFSELGLTLCSPSPCGDPSRLAKMPLVLFSPGLGNSRFLYNFLAQSIASAGYVVVTIDHPQDADIVEFPDGSFTLAANITDDTQINVALDARVADISFVLDSLSKHTISSHLFPSYRGALKTPPVAILGHSLGGATALSAILKDPRVIAGINLDGTFFGGNALHTNTTSHPFLLFGHDGKNQSTDPSWKTVWDRLGGWKLELEFKGAQHGGFEDWPVLIEALGFDELPVGSPLREGIKDVIGTIEGSRAMRIVSEVVAAFLDFTMKGRGSQGLQKIVQEFKELVVVRQA